MQNKLFTSLSFVRGALALSFPLTFLSGCLQDPGFTTMTSAATDAALKSSPPAIDTPTAPAKPSPSATPKPVAAPTQPAAFKICSQLPIASTVTWPSSLTATDDQAFLLGLNLTGSFEGETGWANLTNNFDGEGLSMGLLNQTLGTGSLEPLLVQMRDQHLAKLESVMNPGNAQALLSMLSAWQGSSVQSKLARRPSSDDVGNDESATVVALSPLDIESDNAAPTLLSIKSSSSSNSVAVTWAEDNLYTSSGGFLSAWAKDLNALTTTPEYVSIQINQAVNDHKLALSQQKQIGCTELRCYLLMFDFVVQDGGLYAQDITDYKAYIAANPGNSETENLKQLVELRLRHVRAAYVNDVRSRKDAIIDGTGAVHGVNRNFETQYCFNRMTKYPQ